MKIYHCVVFQLAEEKFGQAEKTEYDEQFESLLQRADKTRDWSEKMIKQMEVVLQPNPGMWLCSNLSTASGIARGQRGKCPLES